MLAQTQAPKGLVPIALALGLAVTAANAQSLDFVVFESDGADGPDLDQISLSAHLFRLGDGVEIQVANTSTPGDNWVTSDTPTITSLFFQDSGNLLIAPSFNAAGSIGTVDYRRESRGNLPGGRRIGYATVFSFSPKPSPVINGVDPDEVASFTFTGSDYDAVLAAINRGEIRIGAHVQQIDDDGSASFVTPIPEPGTGMLALFGLAAVLRRRRR